MSDIVNPDTGEITTLPGAKFWAAFCKAQAVMESPSRSKTATVKMSTGGTYTFSYAPLDAIFAVARKPLADNDLCVYQEVEHDYIRTTIFHSSGESKSSVYPIFHAPNPSAQQFGSGVTYARRYSLMLALGIAAEEDDDGNAADQNQRTIVDRGQQQQQPPRGRPTVVQTQQGNPIREAAVAARNKVRAAIESAKSLDELNKAWTQADQKTVEAYVEGNNMIGSSVWAKLMEEETNKRLELAKAETSNDPLDEFLSEDDVGNALR